MFWSGPSRALMFWVFLYIFFHYSCKIENQRKTLALKEMMKIWAGILIGLREFAIKELLTHNREVCVGVPISAGKKKHVTNKSSS